jgi:hypothetical protein
MAESVNMFAMSLNAELPQAWTMTSILFEHIGEVNVETQENGIIKMLLIFSLDDMSIRESILSSGIKILIHCMQQQGNEMSIEESFRFETCQTDQYDISEPYKALAVAELSLDSLGDQSTKLFFTFYEFSSEGDKPGMKKDSMTEYIHDYEERWPFSSDSLSEHKSASIEDDEFFQRLLKPASEDLELNPTAYDTAMDDRDSLSITDFMLNMYEKQQLLHIQSQQHIPAKVYEFSMIEDSSNSIPASPNSRKLRRSTVLSKMQHSISSSSHERISVPRMAPKPMPAPAAARQPRRSNEGSIADVAIKNRKLNVHHHNAAVRKYDKAWKIKSKTKFPSSLTLPSFSSTKVLLFKEETEGVDVSILSGPIVSPKQKDKHENRSLYRYSSDSRDDSVEAWTPVAQPQPAPLRYYKA